MTNYLNHADKEIVVSLAGCVGMADTLREKKFRHSDDVMEDLQKMQELAQKMINTIIDGIDVDQQSGVLRFANNCELMVLPKSDIRTQTDWCVIEKKDIQTIISNVVSDCSFCDKEGRAVKQCELRKALLNCGMVSSNDSVMKEVMDGCPFRG